MGWEINDGHDHQAQDHSWWELHPKDIRLKRHDLDSERLVGQGANLQCEQCQPSILSPFDAFDLAGADGYGGGDSHFWVTRRRRQCKQRSYG